MKKRVNERSVVMLKDYTNKVKGSTFKCDVAMASHLIAIGVAELSNKVIEPKAEPKKEIVKPAKTKKK